MTMPPPGPTPRGALSRAASWLGNLWRRVTISMALSVCLHLAVAGIISLVLIYYGGLEELLPGGEISVSLLEASGGLEGQGGPQPPGPEDEPPELKPEDIPEPVKIDQAELAKAGEQGAQKALDEIAEAARDAAVSEDTKKAHQEAENVIKEITGKISDGLKEDHKREAESEAFIDQVLKGPESKVVQEAEKVEKDLNLEDAELIEREKELRELVRRLDAKKAQMARQAYEDRKAERQRKAEQAKAEWERKRAEIQAKAAAAQAERDRKMDEIKAAAAKAQAARDAERKRIQQAWAEQEAKRQAAIAARNAKARAEAEANKAALDRRRAEAEAKARAYQEGVRKKIEAAARARAERMAGIRAAAEAAAARRAAEAAARAAAARAEREAERKRLEELAQKANARKKQLEDFQDGKLSWDDAVGLLKKDGLDIVIVFDSTDSMKGELDQLKANIARIGRGLKGIIPKTRISICTYRDKGADYVVKGLPLTADITAAETFLRQISVGPGGDRPEAVQEGLRWAVQENRFGADAKKVILLFGDEPPHPQDLGKCEGFALRFRLQHRGTVNTVTCTRQQGQPTLKEFDRIAAKGGGESTINASSSQIVRQLVRMIFPKAYRNKVDTVIP